MPSLPENNPLILSAEPVEVSKDPDPALFTRERQASFLAALAASGQVRSASARAGVSHQTAYRERLASPGFRRAWDAALLAARAQAEEVLARRAFEGWEEDVVCAPVLSACLGRQPKGRGGLHPAAVFGPAAAGAPCAARQAVRRGRGGGVCRRLRRHPGALCCGRGPAGAALRYFDRLSTQGERVSGWSVRPRGGGDLRRLLAKA